MNWPTKLGLNLHLHPFFFSASSKGCGVTAQMCRLILAFAARICDKYKSIMNWSIKFGLNLHLHPFSFFSASSKGCGDTAQMCRLILAFAARICDKYKSIMNWPIKFGLNLHLHPFFSVRAAKAVGTLRKCAGSSKPSLLAYAINTKVS